ncbi:MAG TPA: hypothetical protein VGH19_21835 [Verrucomicrobiae bacterium]
MKYQYLSLGALALLLVGCSAEDQDELPIATPAASSIEASGSGTRATTTVASYAVDAFLAAPTATVVEQVPVVTDAEEKIALADYTEKVYLRWNAALTTYRQKQSRWPASLHELQQAHPELASFQPPRGFVLNLDKKADEIYLTRVAHQVTAVTPPPNLPPSLNIP